MFDKLFGKEEFKPTAAQQPERRGLEVVDDDPETVWGLWDDAMAQEGSGGGAGGATRPTALDGPSLQQKMERAFQVIEELHPRIANGIRVLWGSKECSDYIGELIMGGYDGTGNARVGFHQDAVQAMLALSDLHDAQFGTAQDNTPSVFDVPASRLDWK